MESKIMEWRPRAHPISDVRDWKNANRLELMPDFQRKEVWTKAAQIALIDTVLLNIPFPKIYIKAVINDEQTYRIVIDGQQRLTAILAFIENKLVLKSPHISNPEYNGLTFSELPEDIRNRVLAYNIDFNEIFDPTDEELRDLYARVNKYTVQLNKQELRRADFPGEFLDLAEKLSSLEFFDNNRFFTAGQARRMLDVEYVSELMALVLEGEQDKKRDLDDFYEKYAKFPQGTTVVEERFKSIIEDISTIFAEGKALSETRFKQKADFYGLFACILEAQNQEKHIRSEALPFVRESLCKLDELIAPHAEEERYREYAIRCISDANSASSRQWRKKFLFDYLSPLYFTDEELEARQK